MRRAIALLLALMLLVLAMPASATLHTQRVWVKDRVNHVRYEYGRRPISTQWRLNNRAQRWADWMAQHDILADDFNGQYTCWRIGGSTYGANAGVGTSVRALRYGGVEYGFEHSPEHLSNIIDGRFRRIGIGVARGHGLTWLVEDFCG